jgi:hypothetical protein
MRRWRPATQVAILNSLTCNLDTDYLSHDSGKHVNFDNIIILLKGLRQGQGRYQGDYKKNGLHINGFKI